MKILIGNELGANLGHMNRIMQISRILTANGHTAEIASTNIIDFSGKIEGGVWPAPVMTSMLKIGPSIAVPESVTHAGMLLSCGLALPGQIRSSVQAWAKIIDTIKPDLVILDHAPTLRIATQGKIPSIVIGNGYLVPPLLNPLPNAVNRETTGSENILAEIIGKEMPSSTIRSASDLMSGDFRIVQTDMEIDPYAEDRADSYTNVFGEKYQATQKSGKKMNQHEIKDYELTPYGVEKGKATGILDLVLLNNAGLPRNKSYFICQPQYETKWKIPNELKEHLKGQAARKNMEQPGRLKIDVLSANFITGMSPKDVENIVAYVSSDYAGIDSKQGYREYVQSGGEPFLAPPEIKSLYVKDGIVRTRIDLSDDVVIEDCVVKTAKINLPEAVLVAIKNRNARSVIDHPLIPEEAIVTEIKLRTNKMLIPLQIPYIFIDSLLSYHKNNPNPYDSDSQQVIMARDALRKNIIKVG